MLNSGSAAFLIPESSLSPLHKPSAGLRHSLPSHKEAIYATSLGSQNSILNAAAAAAAGILSLSLVRARRRVSSRLPVVARWVMTPKGGDVTVPGVMIADHNNYIRDEDVVGLPPQVQAEGRQGEYCAWVIPKSKLPDLLKEWAASDKASEEQSKMLESLAALEFEKGLTAWALSGLEGAPGPGFYMAPPRPPQAIAIVEAVDAGQNNIQHVAVCPSDISPTVCQAFRDWVETLRPKKVVVKRPKQLKIFGLLDLVREDSPQPGQAAAGPKVSKGL
eukprot:TRINITY_DN42123_c0_g1_i1.p1 TRINITY_DN42123_c0_g1~~TRINITY_DN42123_c0_g1_i1.p1  ORF type:complete len:276 (-),score=53.43 TRINITY_DN42123_c0_g1_i1:52-879(-)